MDIKSKVEVEVAKLLNQSEEFVLAGLFRGPTSHVRYWMRAQQGENSRAPACLFFHIHSTKSSYLLSLAELGASHQQASSLLLK